MRRAPAPRRGDVLRDVVTAANQRRDRTLPTDVPGVSQVFADELDLLGALLLRWHARLSARLEAALAEHPLDLPGAVADAWRQAYEDLPGVRDLLDHCTDHPVDEPTGAALERARRKEWQYLAAAAGLAHGEGAAATRAGRQLAEQIRSGATSPSRALRPADAGDADRPDDTGDPDHTDHPDHDTTTLEVPMRAPRFTGRQQTRSTHETAHQTAHETHPAAHRPVPAHRGTAPSRLDEPERLSLVRRIRAALAA